MAIKHKVLKLSFTIVCLTVGVFLLLLATNSLNVTLNFMKIKHIISQLNQSTTKSKLIVLWESSNRMAVSEQECTDMDIPGRCDLTWDRHKYKEADGIIFHPRPRNWQDRLIKPPERFPWQFYVAFTVESASTYRFSDPSIIPVLSTFEFNLTSTFRSDSDLPVPYLCTKRRDKPCNECLPNSTILTEKHKEKPMSWVVSRCKASNKREEYFSQLSKHISVDIFGRCGKELTSSCPREIYEEICTENIIRKYKFYFSAENSICKDYLTEKLFRPLNNSVIPVVYGPRDVHKVAPPHSYIDVRDFKSPKHLADYLLYLDKNDTAYMEYFEWRKYFEVKWGKKTSIDAFCHLCRYMHTNNSRRTLDFNDWFFNNSGCTDPEKEINYG